MVRHIPAIIGACLVALGFTAMLHGAEDHHHSGDSVVQVRPGETQAQAYDRFVEERLKHTYAATAVRMLAECGEVVEGTCIDLGCGSGHLDVELARRSKLKIIGLDIDADMKPLFEKRIREAGLQDRVSFVHGDAQKLPFPDRHADLIVSRGMLTFLPEIKKCLQEVRRVLKPGGVAFLGGRYLYAPNESKITTEAIRKIVAESGVAEAQVVEGRGQWVKIIGPEAPQAARGPLPGGKMLAWRLVADYAITKGDCLLICRADGGMEQALQQGLADLTEFRITALYPSEKLAEAARTRLQKAGLDRRIACAVGDVQALPFAESAFDLVAGVGGVPFWNDREKAIREIHRVLRPGGAALAGGVYRSMPEWRKVSSESLRQSAAKTGISTIRVIDDMGQWIEVRKPPTDRVPDKP